LPGPRDVLRALSRHRIADYRKIIALNVEALNQSIKDLPADRMRMHVCWGSTLGPHHGDVPLKDIVDIILKANPQAVSFPGANPRHGHEWKVWQDVKLPDGKAIIPGVIDSTSNFVEHPELVADRIVQYAKVVGRENVIPAPTAASAPLPAASGRHQDRVDEAYLAQRGGPPGDAPAVVIRERQRLANQPGDQ
jgi:methionine synthase II (cobalamin-independent)